MAQRQQPSRPVAIDLFAGAGGFSLGIEQAGFDVVAAVEKDPVHASVHRFNFPHSPVLCADLTDLSGREIWAIAQQAHPRLARQRLDLLVGGPPCQGFSIMGKRSPSDARNSLIFHFCRLVRELQPRYFAMENVPGLRSPRYRALLDRLLADFAAAGYRTSAHLLNAADFSVPQDRKRLFLLGSQSGESPFTPPSPPLFQFAPTVGDALRDLPNLDDFPHLFDTDELELSPAALSRLEAAASDYVRLLRESLADPENYAYPRVWNRGLLTGFRRTRHTAHSIDRFHATLPGQLEPISRLRRLDWSRRCCTLRAGTNSERGRHTSARPLHPHRDRVICVREAARLHSFPDWFRFHATKWHGFREVGNAVPPLLGRAIGCQAIAALGCTPVKPEQLLRLGDRQLLALSLRDAARYWQQPDLAV